MSVQLISWAYAQETGSSTRKAVLLALANRANHDTGTCFPSLSRLAKETEMSKRTVQRCLDDLEDLGLILRINRTRGNGSLTSSIYAFPHIVTTPMDTLSIEGIDTVASPEPEVSEPKENPIATPSQRESKPRKPNPVWDALAYVFGAPTTESARKVRGKVAASITLAGGTGEEVVARAKRWPQHFPGATMTDLALEKHWHTLARKPLRRTG